MGDVADELTYRTVPANGLEFHVAEAGDGEDLALLLHGFPELAFSWRHQLPALAGAGYRAWAPDLRGYGGTTRPTAMADYAMEHLMDDVEALVAAAGVESTTLIAHDWGALIAWQVAMRRPELVDRLVIMNVPHPSVADRVLRRSPRQMLRSWYVFFFQLPWLPEKLLGARGARAIGKAFSDMAVHPERFDDEVLDVYRQAALEPGALTAMVNYYRALVRGGGARRMKKLGTPVIETPTLMVWGEQDSALGIEMTEGTEEHVADLTLHRLPDASHWVQQDAPDEVNAILTAWLSPST